MVHVSKMYEARSQVPIFDKYLHAFSTEYQRSEQPSSRVFPVTHPPCVEAGRHKQCETQIDGQTIEK